MFALHVDNGFMRLNESRKVKEAISVLGLNLRVVDASESFYHGRTSINGEQTDELRNVATPEVKRKIIGDVFMKVSQEEIDRLGLQLDTCFLAQGTLRPDLIESASNIASSSADVIKTHHNGTPLYDSQIFC